MQLFERKRQVRSIDRSFSTRSKSPVTRLVRNPSAQTPYSFNNTNSKQNRTSRDRSFTNLRLNNTVSNPVKMNTSYNSDTKISLKKDKSLKYFFKSPNKEDLRQDSNNEDNFRKNKFTNNINITNKSNLQKNNNNYDN